MAQALFQTGSDQNKKLYLNNKTVTRSGIEQYSYVRRQKLRYLSIIAAATVTAIHGSAAYATDTVQLPNGVTVPYYGQGEPSFQLYTAPYGSSYYVATEANSTARRYYSAAGAWVGSFTYEGNTNGLNAQIAGLPIAPLDIPTSVTLPNGLTVPYNGSGLPEVGLTTPTPGFSPNFIYFVRDPVSGAESIYDAQGRMVPGNAVIYFPVSGGGTTSTGGAVSSSFGGSTGGGTSGGTISSSSNGGSSGGPTGSGGGVDVPAPGGFLLFGLGAAAAIVARRRAKKR
jgi:hypothetical protein